MTPGPVDRCEATTGWKMAATRRHLRLVGPEVYTSGVSRQEEQALPPHRYRSDVLSARPYRRQPQVFVLSNSDLLKRYSRVWRMSSFFSAAAEASRKRHRLTRRRRSRSRRVSELEGRTVKPATDRRR